ncbi:MAG TPA: phospholipase D-like domain-containing protein [Candidatus Saccharimonadales bacterium]|nr:phospholipase D-like domain-containing protein [Candidatus Saccharimonadales bacterium]
MFSLFKHSAPPVDLLTSKLYDQDTFYTSFLKDLSNCHSEVIIECPFITSRRLRMLMPTLEKLKARKVRIAINTRDPRTHDGEYWRDDAHDAVSKLQHMGVQVLYTSDHHRKLAILDRKILYEGSLNILSQNNSSEIMRRIESVQLAWQMARFIGIDKYLN